MITKYSNSTTLYDELFKKATERLQQLQVTRPGTKDKYGATDADGIKVEVSSLEEYFSNLRNLIYGSGEVELDEATIREGYIFLKLPVDEPYFEIKANSREIIVPPEFKKNGISVLGDEVSEMLFFSIDRFYDATDLSHMKIGFYWTHSADPDQTLYETPAFFSVIEQDEENGDDKLVFGWPISSEMTRLAGKVTFSVRFYAENPVVNEDSDEYSLSYSLSTLPQTVFINNGLTYDIKNVDVDNRLEQILDYRIVNSSIDGRHEAPVVPELAFSATYVNGVAHTDLREFVDQITGARKLVALGYRKGPGTLTYAWYHMEDGQTEATQLSSNFTSTVQEVDNYIPITQYIPNIATYFIGGGNGGEWKTANNTPIANEGEFNALLNRLGVNQVYVRCTTWTLDEDNVRPGVYYALPRNSLYGSHSPVHKNTIPENHHWTVLGPEQPVLNNAFGGLTEVWMENGRYVLHSNSQNTDGGTEWQWYYKSLGDNSVYTLAEHLVESDATVVAEGDYYVTVTNKKNGGRLDVTSSPVRVLNDIADINLSITKNDKTLTATHRDLSSCEYPTYTWMKNTTVIGTSYENASITLDEYDTGAIYSVQVTIAKGSADAAQRSKNFSATLSNA